MAQHDLKYATLLQRNEPIGESLLATARKAIVAKYSLIPAEVFIDGVAVTGTLVEGDLTLDLDALGVNLVTFGAAGADASPIAAAPVESTPPAPTTVDEPVAPAPEAVTTTTSSAV